MAFPKLVTLNTSSVYVPPGGGNWDCSMPWPQKVDRLALSLSFGSPSATITTNESGWTSISNAVQGALRHRVYYRFVVGDAFDSDQFSMGSTGEMYAIQLMLGFDDIDKSVAPSALIGAALNSSSIDIDPRNLGTSVDRYWLTVYSWIDTTVIGPSNFPPSGWDLIRWISTPFGVNNLCVAVCGKTSSASTEDPGAVTLNGSADVTFAGTIAITGGTDAPADSGSASTYTVQPFTIY